MLIVEQLLRIAVSEATNAAPGLDPDRANYTLALSTAKDLIDLVPTVDVRHPQPSGWQALARIIGAHVLDRLLPERRMCTRPWTVMRANSKYQARASKLHGPT